MKLGARHSKETKEKIRRAHLGKKQSKETRKKRSKSLLGREISKETREKIREKALGRKQSKATIEKRRRSLRARYDDPIRAKKRFWAKVDKSHGEDSCWPWLRSLSNGYGRMMWMGKQQLAHRVAWQIEHRAILQGLCVLHHCDNPSCVNPRHLFLGTRIDNVQDKVNKNRQARGADLHVPKGEDHPGSKLTEKDIREIRKLAASGISQERIAKRMKLTQPYVHNVINRKVWKHI